MKAEVDKAISRVTANFSMVAASQLPQADKTFLERLTMQGQPEAGWDEITQRRYLRLANAISANE